MDIVSREKRSQIMAGIKSRNTKPEIIIRKYFYSIGFRFRLNQKIINTKPDLVLKKYHTCIFVHGCFWHRHKFCKIASTPKTNTDFWEKKFEENINRDKRNIENLLNAGWRVGVIWECSIRSGRFRDFNFMRALTKTNFWELE
jgi:DNA mismatch endonuclease (patch repair protein)